MVIVGMRQKGRFHIRQRKTQPGSVLCKKLRGAHIQQVLPAVVLYKKGKTVLSAQVFAVAVFY